MNVLLGRIISLTALAAFASTGVMQAAEQATFHLPVTAHWGMAVLQPGDYKLSLPSPGLGKTLLRVESTGNSVFELPLVVDVQSTSNSSYLQLREIDGNYYVTAFSSGESGKKYEFSAPKTRQKEQLAKSGDSSVSVSVN